MRSISCDAAVAWSGAGPEVAARVATAHKQIETKTSPHIIFVPTGRGGVETVSNGAFSLVESYFLKNKSTLGTEKMATVPVADLDLEQVVSLLTQWKLNRYMTEQ